MVWSVNGMGKRPPGDAGFSDDRRDLAEVHRRHDVRAGHAGNVGELAQYLDANLAPFALRIARAFEALDEALGDDRAVELVAHPARRARRRNRRDADEDRDAHAMLREALHVAA